MAYTPPECGLASFSIGEIRNHGCTGVIFYLRDSLENGAVITDDVDIELLLNDPPIALVIQREIENVSIDTTLQELELKSPSQFAINESLEMELTLEPVELSLHVLSTVSDLLEMEVEPGEGGMGAGPLFPPSFIKDGGRLISWGGNEKQDRQVSTPFGTPDWKDVPKKIPWVDNENQNRQYSTPWISGIPADHQTEVPWNEFFDFADKHINHPWTSILFFIDTPKKIPWADGQRFEARFGIPYTYPLPNDIPTSITWEGRSVIRHSVEVRNPFTLKVPFKDTQRTIRWGPRDLTWVPCEPGSRFEKPTCGKNWYRLDEDMEDLTGICKDVVMVLQCDNRVYNPHHYFHTGNRDSFWVKPLPHGDDTPVYGENVYIVENTILVKRLSDNEEIEVTAVSCRIDKKSWLWDFTLTVPSKTQLNLLKPYKSGDDTLFHDIEISINQNIWTCRVETWAENRVFGQDSWTLTGRSPSSELTEPFSIPESFLSTLERQGGTLIDDILLGSGWESEWGYDDNATTYSDYINPFVDWLIPADGYSYTDLTKKAGVLDVIQSIGGFAQTKAECYLPDDKRIILNPNYIKDPWLWPLETAAVSIPEALCKEISRSFTPYKRVDGVIVSGVDHGVIVNATRQGLAGLTYAPMITHSLISTTEAGSERARSELAKTGMWSTHQLNLFSLKVPESVVDLTARLILPGELVLVTEGVGVWKGQASATTVNAVVGPNGAKDVMQSITVEEYIG